MKKKRPSYFSVFKTNTGVRGAGLKFGPCVPLNAIWQLKDEDWGSTVGDQFLFARWGTKFADRRHSSGYKDLEPGTWRFLLPPENMAPAYLTPSSFDGPR